LKELRTLLFQRALYNYHAVMYFKKEIIISFFIITISASDLYMPMIWLYLFLLDFLIPFLCDPDLQCVAGFSDVTSVSAVIGVHIVTYWLFLNCIIL
jgi:hypothetical protein